MQAGLAIQNVSAIIGLTEAEMRGRKSRRAKIAIMKWNYRNQRVEASVIKTNADRLETRHQMTAEAFRIHSVSDDCEMLERADNVDASYLGSAEMFRCEAQRLSQNPEPLLLGKRRVVTTRAG